MTRMTASQVMEHQARVNGTALNMSRAAKPSRMRNVRTSVDGIVFDSRREANYYIQLKARRDAGEIKSFIPQVSMPIGKSRRRLRLDFIVVHHDDRCEFVDAKGFATEVWKIKRDEFEANYKVKVVTV